mgnify:CR=1 FL=1
MLAAGSTYCRFEFDSGLAALNTPPMNAEFARDQPDPPKGSTFAKFRMAAVELDAGCAMDAAGIERGKVSAAFCRTTTRTGLRCTDRLFYCFCGLRRE